MRIEVKIDDRGFTKATKRIRREADKMIEDEIKVAGRTTAKNAKSFAPVRQSALKNSIRVKQGDMESGVGTDIKYGPFVEFGTGSGVRVPSELSSYAMQFKGQGIREVNTRAQPYLYPAFFTERDRLNRRIDKKTEKIFKRNSR